MKGAFTIAASGDSIITRRVTARSDREFLDLMALIRGADAAFTNLEIMTPREPWVPSSEYGGMHLGAPEFVLDELAACGFNLFNVANNHAVDYTYQGLVDTIAALRRRNLVFAGGGMTLGEARAPGYLEVAGRRVALIAAASTFMTGALAAESRTDVGGRPGVNPLRYQTRYVVDDMRFEALREIDEALGTASTVRRQRAFGIRPQPDADVYRFLQRDFVRGETTEVSTSPDARDLDEICRWIGEARRQADLVIVSLHAHEGLCGDSNTAQTAHFIRTAAHRFVDAGADLFVGHGPHVLRPIEIYRGRPLFYSLGNFMFMFEGVTKLPSEMYERHRLPPTATPADVHDAWAFADGGKVHGFHADPAFWQSVVPVCRYEGDGLQEIELHPVTLRLDGARTARGEPRLAEPEAGRDILQRLRRASSEFGTEIAIQGGAGRVVGRVALDAGDR